MKIVIGGLGRKSGKTSMICRILRLYAERNWLAIKITAHCHSPETEPFRFTEETEPGDTGDTRRYLAAGARRAVLLEGNLDAAMRYLSDDGNMKRYFFRQIGNDLQAFINYLGAFSPVAPPSTNRVNELP